MPGAQDANNNEDLRSILEMDSDNGFITVLIYFTSIGCTLKNGKFYVRYILPKKT